MFPATCCLCVMIIVLLVLQSRSRPVIAVTLGSVAYVSGIITIISTKQMSGFPYDLVYLFAHTSLLSMALSVLSSPGVCLATSIG